MLVSSISVTFVVVVVVSNVLLGILLIILSFFILSAHVILWHAQLHLGEFLASLN